MSPGRPRRDDFPLLAGQPGLHYLDSAATSQKPSVVLDAIRGFYETANANPHRGAYSLSVKATEAYHDARARIARFFGVADPATVIFTRGTTESVNLVASSWGGVAVQPGDDVIVTAMDHHGNFVPWQQLAIRQRGHLRIWEMEPDGTLDLDKLRALLSNRTAVVAFNHVSNALGTVNPVREIADLAREAGATTVCDGAQSAPHMKVDFAELGVDFYAFSGHKMCGPMGIGALFIKKGSDKHLHSDISGGSAVSLVSKHVVAHADAPAKFEPGTQDIEGAIEWGFTLDYLRNIGMDRIEQHDKALGQYFLAEVRKIPGITVLGPNELIDRTSVFSFVVGPEKPLLRMPLHLTKNYDEIAVALDDYGISVRDGCFCAHIYIAHLLELPSYLNTSRTLVMKAGVDENMFKLPGAVRVSFSFYNTLGEAYTLIRALREIRKRPMVYYQFTRKKMKQVDK